MLKEKNKFNIENFTQKVPHIFQANIGMGALSAVGSAVYSSDSSTYKSSVDDRISTANTKISTLTTRFWNAYSSTSGSDLLYTELCSFVSSSLTFNC